MSHENIIAQSSKLKAHYCTDKNLSHLYTAFMLSLVLPTFNEAANIVNLLDTIDGVLRDLPHEIIVVDDDSPDGTWKVAGECAKRRPGIKVLRRIGKKGLSSAVMDGFDASHGQVIAVMDADGQHDAALLLRLVAAIKQGAGVAIGSRYVAGGSVGDWVADRRIISNAGTFVAKRLSRVPVSDPLGGFFAIRTELYKTVRPSLRPTGFKILLEILANIKAGTTITEVPLVFRMRLHGESKLSLQVQMEFLSQVLRLGSMRLMHSFSSLAAAIFIVAAVAAVTLTLPRVLALRLLFTDAGIREQAQMTIKFIAARQGWLVSDIEVRSVSQRSIDILHRDHLRFDRPVRHCTADLGTSNLTCVD